MASLNSEKPVACKVCTDGVSPNYCPNCRHCKIHLGCECRVCGLCRLYRSPKNFCKKCTRCKQCHLEGENFVDEFPLRPCRYNPPYGDPLPVWKHQINTLRRTLGMELEIGTLGTLRESSHSGPTNLNWHYEHDGSVTPSGKELVTGISGGDQFLSGITSLTNHLHTCGCAINSSCGLHVHVDAADLGYLELRRILVGFCIFLPQIWGTLVAPARQHNQYCPAPPITAIQLRELMNFNLPSEVRDWFHKFLYQVGPMESYSVSEKRAIVAKLKEYKAKKYIHTARRMAINFHSWMMRGTVEFRLKEATLDPSDLMMFPLWCGWFVEVCQGVTDKEVGMWLKDPPSLVQLADDCMPKAVAKWVKMRVEKPAPNPPAPGSEGEREAEEEEDDEPPDYDYDRDDGEEDVL